MLPKCEKASHFSGSQNVHRTFRCLIKYLNNNIYSAAIESTQTLHGVKRNITLESNQRGNRASKKPDSLDSRKVEKVGNIVVSNSFNSRKVEQSRQYRRAPSNSLNSRKVEQSRQNRRAPS